MTVYEIPNIEHCTVEPISTIGYRIFANEGWYIHLGTSAPGVDEDGNPTKPYKTVVILWNTYDFSQVEITAEADLPENAEINAGGGNDHEVM